MSDQSIIAYPYGYQSDGSAHCINVEPGTFNHECGQPARNIGVKDNGYRAMFCDHCKANGHEAKQYHKWTALSD